MTGRRLPAALLVVVLAAAALAGCVRVPDSGPVVETRSEGQVASTSGIFIDPRPPQPGETPAEVVKGFLNAMQATPIQTRTAREFLTNDAAASWNPQREIITYASASLPRENQHGVSITLSGAHRLDSRGAWRGALPDSRRTLTFPMAYDGHNWRIDAAPDALVVPETWFEQRFRQVSLYFFDPTASILVPEPVFVPRGEQLASTLTQALLMGPGPGLGRVTQTFLPSGLRVAVGVAVSNGGVADILLNGDPGQLTGKTTELMMAQLAWTLRQEPQIQSVRVSINGEPIPLPGGVSSYRVDGGAEYDPAGFQASPDLYALRGGHVVSGGPSGLAPVGGPFGTKDFGLRSIGLSLEGTRLAGVGLDGRSVLVGPVGDTGRVETVASGGTDFLPPGWDFSGRAWLVDRAPGGARVSYVEGTTVRALRVPGITGRQVDSFLVSRDGTRLVAVVQGRPGDTLLVSRIEHAANGRVTGATRARQINAGADSELQIRAIAWRTPTSVGVLSPFTPSLAKVGDASVDGSPSTTDAASSTVEGALRGLAGSPVDGESLYGITPHGLIDVADQRSVTLEHDPTSITYVG